MDGVLRRVVWVAMVSLAIFVVCVPAAGGGGRVGVPQQKTIAVVDHLLFDFAQDGARVAWAAHPCGSITIRDLAMGRDYSFGDSSCDLSGNVPMGFGAFALGGTRVISWDWWHGNDYYQDVFVDAIGGGGRQLTETISVCDDSLIAGLAADGNVALYAKLEDNGGTEDDPCGPPWLKGGGVYAANPQGTSSRRLPGVPPTVALAVYGSLLAVIPLDPNPRRAGFHPVPNGPVEVHSARTGKLRTSVQPDGTPLAVGISQDVLAVLVRAMSGSKRIDLFDPRSGASRGSKIVPQNIAPELSVAGNRVVYRVKRSIYLLDSRSGKRSIVATASARPIGLSIEGPRIAWGENVGGRGRIIALQLPPH